MKPFFITLLLLITIALKAQKIDSIFVNLYTDSLKKGTYNYINIDGLLSNGQYLPLDSSQILFSASSGKFVGNTLFIDKNFTLEKVNIKVVLKSNIKIFKIFDMFIKTKEEPNLKTIDELLNEENLNKKKSKKKAT